MREVWTKLYGKSSTKEETSFGSSLQSPHSVQVNIHKNFTHLNFKRENNKKILMFSKILTDLFPGVKNIIQ